MQGRESKLRGGGRKKGRERKRERERRPQRGNGKKEREREKERETKGKTYADKHFNGADAILCIHEPRHKLLDSVLALLRPCSSSKSK